ncbi:MAG: DDE-type integrase/transposase/recombinase [Cyanobacteria bacterium J06641_5]
MKIGPNRSAQSSPLGYDRNDGINIGHTWFVDETYVKIGGRWCYLYRGIDKCGKLVDVFLSEHRDMAAAKAFFQKAFDLLQTIPERVIIDGHKPYPGAVEKVLGKEVEHRVSRCMDNPIEQSHRKIE